ELIGSDDSHYKGNFRDWRFSGNGRLRLADGSVYVGGFENDTYQGNGRLTLVDGRSESGLWLNGQRVRDEHGKLLPDPLELALLNQGSL
ncbi:peptidase C13, partial [Pseudomonas frederiksbergensis]|nr:peptidase C13 [Pseudomonas frederiksbergensis]